MTLPLAVSDHTYWTIALVIGLVAALIVATLLVALIIGLVAARSAGCARRSR